MGDEPAAGEQPGPGELKSIDDGSNGTPASRRGLCFLAKHRLAEITCPTLVIAASNDEAVPPHHAKMLHDGIADSQLVIVDGADHALIWALPAELVRLAEGFLEG
jgi:3-oxoadipate enol-lactonase